MLILSFFDASHVIFGIRDFPFHFEQVRPDDGLYLFRDDFCIAFGNVPHRPTEIVFVRSRKKPVISYVWVPYFFIDQDELTFLAFAKLFDSIPQFLFKILESKVRDFLVFLKFGGKME